MSGDGQSSDRGEPASATAPLSSSVQRTSLRTEGRTKLLGSLGALGGLSFALFAALKFVPDAMMTPALIFGLEMMMMLGLLLACAPLVAAALLPRRQTVVPLQTDAEHGLTVGNVALSASEVGTVWAKRPKVAEVLTVSGDEFEIELPEASDTRALVAGLRSRLVARPAYPVRLEGDFFRLTRKTWAWLTPMSFAAVVSWISPLFLLTFVPAALLSWWVWRGTHRAHFGADGVEIESRHRRRYVAYKDIERVVAHPHLAGTRRIELYLGDGGRVRAGFFVSEERARLVTALIEEGVAMASAGEAAGAHVTGLEREEDSTAEWRARVAGVIRGGSYRGTAVDAERLESLMRNPSAAREQRVAAALALREQPNNLARIRVAASVSTEPDVREALEEIGREAVDEARLDRVLRRL